MHFDENQLVAINIPLRRLFLSHKKRLPLSPLNKPDIPSIKIARLTTTAPPLPPTYYVLRIVTSEQRLYI